MDTKIAPCKQARFETVIRAPDILTISILDECVQAIIKANPRHDGNNEADDCFIFLSSLGLS